MAPPRGGEGIPQWLCFRGLPGHAESGYTHRYTKKSRRRRHAWNRANRPVAGARPESIVGHGAKPAVPSWAYLSTSKASPRGYKLRVFRTRGTPTAKASTNAGAPVLFCFHPTTRPMARPSELAPATMNPIVVWRSPSPNVCRSPVGDQTLGARPSQIDSHTTATSAPQDGSRTNKAFRPAAKSAMR